MKKFKAINCTSFALPRVEAMVACFALGAALVLGISSTPVQAAPFHQGSVLRHQAQADIPLLRVREVVRRGGAVVGPRGGVAVRRTTVVRPGYRPGYRPVRPGYVRPGYAGGGVRWARPGWYRWPPGGAIAAGAALGFVAAGTAVAWAGAPPAPGYCWYYTDASQRQGFWDVCP